jgi:hypothetical protein
VTDPALRRPIVYTLLVGVLLQVAMAVLYKSAMWYLYIAADKTGDAQDAFKQTHRYRFSNTVSEWYWLEILADVTTLGLLRIFDKSSTGGNRSVVPTVAAAQLALVHPPGRGGRLVSGPAPHDRRDL